MSVTGGISAHNQVVPSCRDIFSVLFRDLPKCCSLYTRIVLYNTMQNLARTQGLVALAVHCEDLVRVGDTSPAGYSGSTVTAPTTAA
jgi:hypothetical protein